MKKVKLRVFTLLAAAVFMTACAAHDKPVITQNSPKPAEIFSAADEPSAEPQTYTPLNYDTQKAVWISYIELADMLADTEDEFRENMREAFENAADLGCNTVYVHVRAFGDAYYNSRLYVLSKYLPTEDGTLRYDPLDVMTDTAHDVGLSFHAWINPFRCDTAENMDRMKGTQIYEWYSDPEKYDEYVIRPNGDDYYWLNPGKPEVRNLIAEGAAEIAENYDVDGIHIDDYFYPTTDESFDGNTYAADGSGAELSDWRLENCSETVRSIYRAVKSADSEILFGVSPQGNISNNYTQMFADVKLWCSEDGYIDYIAPQIYFGYNNTVCPFSQTLEEWRGIVTNENVSLVCGIGVYKLDSDDEFADSEGIIARQIGEAFENGCGIALYSYSGLFGETDERHLREREASAEILTE